MSISGISSSVNAYQPVPVAEQQHKRAEPARSESSSQPLAPQKGAFHGVSGASGRIDIKA